MTRDETVAFFDSHAPHWARRDPAALATAHAEHGIVMSPMFARVRGRAAIEASYQSLFKTFPDWDFQQRDLVVDGDQAAQTFFVTATHSNEFLGLRGTGRRVELKGVRLFTFEGGLVQTERRLYDFTGLLVQIGVLKARTS